MNSSHQYIEDKNKCYFEFLDPLESYQYFKNNRETDKMNYMDLEKEKQQNKIIKLRIDLEKKEVFNCIKDLKDQPKKLVEYFYKILNFDLIQDQYNDQGSIFRLILCKKYSKILLKLLTKNLTTETSIKQHKLCFNNNRCQYLFDQIKLCIKYIY